MSRAPMSTCFAAYPESGKITPSRIPSGKTRRGFSLFAVRLRRGVTVRTGESVRVAAAHPCGEHATVHVGCERLLETVQRSIPNDSR